VHIEHGDDNQHHEPERGMEDIAAKSAGSGVIGRPCEAGDTALAQIVALVQQAQNSKAPGQRLADRAASWLVLVALLGGMATFLVWLAVGRPVTEALLFAITVVVITCPVRRESGGNVQVSAHVNGAFSDLTRNPDHDQRTKGTAVRDH
jgi:hypothetical protein